MHLGLVLCSRAKTFEGRILPVMNTVKLSLKHWWMYFLVVSQWPLRSYRYPSCIYQNMRIHGFTPIKWIICDYPGNHLLMILRYENVSVILRHILKMHDERTA